MDVCKVCGINKANLFYELDSCYYLICQECDVEEKINRIPVGKDKDSSETIQRSILWQDRQFWNVSKYDLKQPCPQIRSGKDGREGVCNNFPVRKATRSIQVCHQCSSCLSLPTRPKCVTCNLYVPISG